MKMMHKFIAVVSLFAALLVCAPEACAQFPGMRNEAWYKSEVLKADNPDEAIVEDIPDDSESVLSKMNKLSAGRKWKEVLDTYPDAKKEMGRNPNIYKLALVAARNVVGESRSTKDLDILMGVYNDYYTVGQNAQESYRYTGRNNEQQFNDMQMMIDYARFSENVDYNTRYNKIMEFVNQQGEKADPWILYSGILVPLSSEFASNIAAIRKDTKQSDKYYQQFTEIQNMLEAEDAFVKGNSSNYDAYAMADKIEACEKNRMLVIPFDAYQKLHPMSEIEAHKDDEAYLAKLSQELERWPNEQLTKTVLNYYNNIGASFAKFNTLGDRYYRSKSFAEAISAYNRALELAENDAQRLQGYMGLAQAQNLQRSYSAANQSVLKAIAIDGNNMNAYIVRAEILSNSSSTVKGSDNVENACDLDVLFGEVLRVLQEGLARCDQDEQPELYEKGQKKLAEARKMASRYTPPKSQLFMKGINFGQSWSMKSGEIRFTGTIRDYTGN